MGWFTIWHWALAFLFVAVPLGYLIVGIVILSRTRTDNPGVSGLGGWMIIIVIVQLLLPVPFVLNIPDLLEQYERVKGTERGPLSVGGQIAISLVVLPIVIVTIVALFRRSRRFPALYAMQWSILFVLPAIGFFWEAWSLGVEYHQLARFYHFGTVLGALLTVIIGGGTLWYLCSSRRSKNTFVR